MQGGWTALKTVARNDAKREDDTVCEIIGILLAAGASVDAADDVAHILLAAPQCHLAC